MAGVIKPLYINGTEYDAEGERRGLGGLVAQSSAGVARTGALGPAPAVSLSGSNVQVGPFNCAIGSTKGVYLTGVDSVTSAGTLGVADATNGRLDRVVLEVLDPDNGSGGTTRLGRLRIITGTPAALPGLPALPPLALHVASVQVPKSGAGSPVVTVDAPLTAAAGAPIPVRSQAERDAVAAVDGTIVQRLDRQGTLQHAVVTMASGTPTTRWFEPGGVLGYKQMVANSNLGSSNLYVELPAFNLSFETVGGRAASVEFSGVMSGNAGAKYGFIVTVDGTPVRRSQVDLTATALETAFNFTGRTGALGAGTHNLQVLGAHLAGPGGYTIYGPGVYGQTYVAVRDDGVA
ncbi:hypothetical protein LJ753_16860 [Arthrobacter sp. zg-Y20]|uniref:hypothetical protein n=1 Tax=unclassified Arthrobacter TaxID=235627 RepID=UPI001D137C23|nr:MULTISPECIES: hypothetical protein [unclassified Arthrobacter]MCC3277537.1 hypothetical protein [Arthrobacter sp. zg-Y20]MDK1317695.1 hypothetical protein [Arthrobacter sp. zg.Y20]WIB07046.1 hypothetical protein QNO06_04780 [Arthrobacter sp. zg-Y20]